VTTTEKLRVVICLDREAGTAFAAVLNSENNKWAPITHGEHGIKDPDDPDQCIEAMNLVCEDIQRWAESSRRHQ
jgi:hypothetical protein